MTLGSSESKHIASCDCAIGGKVFAVKSGRVNIEHGQLARCSNRLGAISTMISVANIVKSLKHLG